jgi:hypothetical protein
VTTSLQEECERNVSSLRADKAGKLRLSAPDGSEFTAAEAGWITQALRRTDHESAPRATPMTRRAAQKR